MTTSGAAWMDTQRKVGIDPCFGISGPGVATWTLKPTSYQCTPHGSRYQSLPPLTLHHAALDLRCPQAAANLSPVRNPK